MLARLEVADEIDRKEIKAEDECRPRADTTDDGDIPDHHPGQDEGQKRDQQHSLKKELGFGREEAQRALAEKRVSYGENGRLHHDPAKQVVDRQGSIPQGDRAQRCSAFGELRDPREENEPQEGASDSRALGERIRIERQPSSCEPHGHSAQCEEDPVHRKRENREVDAEHQTLR